MIGTKKVLGLIPARGGSKGVPRKNIRMARGKPLIAWTIEAARQSRYIDRVVLSSDDEEIMRVAAEHGCEVPLKRPAELAADHTPGIDPVLHALECLPGYDYVVLLQPTSPSRSAEDIDACLEKCEASSAPCCVSVVECDEHPYLMYWTGERGRMRAVVPEGERVACRQQFPKVFRLNGAVYAARVEWLKHTRSFISGDTVAYEMPRERSLDIDTEEDLCKFNNMEPR